MRLSKDELAYHRHVRRQQEAVDAVVASWSRHLFTKYGPANIDDDGTITLAPVAMQPAGAALSTATEFDLVPHERAPDADDAGTE